MRAHLVAIVACVCGAVAEATFAGRDANATLNAFKQPSWAPRPWLWYAIGVGYYAACYVVVYRLMVVEPALRWPALGLVFATMAANAFWNLLFFRLKHLKAVNVYNFAYAALVLLTLWNVYAADRVAFVALGLYALYLPYALVLGVAWSRLNPR